MDYDERLLNRMLKCIGLEFMSYKVDVVRRYACPDSMKNSVWLTCTKCKDVPVCGIVNCIDAHTVKAIWSYKSKEELFYKLCFSIDIFMCDPSYAVAACRNPFIGCNSREEILIKLDIAEVQEDMVR